MSEQRLELAETQLAYQEKTIEELNQSLIKLQLEMLQLREQILLLGQKLKSSNISQMASFAEETPPPHY